LPTIDTNFCPYKVEYDSNEDDGQSASAEVPELVLHSCDKDTATSWFFLSKGRTNRCESRP
jgi:hypothetical protein